MRPGIMAVLEGAAGLVLGLAFTLGILRVVWPSF